MRLMSSDLRRCRVAGQILRRCGIGRAVARPDATARSGCIDEVDFAIDMACRIAKRERAIFHRRMARRAVRASRVRWWRWISVTAAALRLRTVDDRPRGVWFGSAPSGAAVAAGSACRSVPYRPASALRKRDFRLPVAVHVTWTVDLGRHGVAIAALNGHMPRRRGAHMRLVGAHGDCCGCDCAGDTFRRCVAGFGSVAIHRAPGKWVGIGRQRFVARPTEICDTCGEHQRGTQGSDTAEHPKG